jgi:precorrin-3B C17-methyltransferase
LVQEQERGKISVVGIGPGAQAHMTALARRVIEKADVILGYETYLGLIADLASDTPREVSGMRQEVVRVGRAIDLAEAGRHVALVSGGDAGVYGMAGLVYEILHLREQQAVQVEVVPGVSALNAAAALLGAPLMTDFCAISLSDQLVPLDEVLRRVDLAAQADFCICLYNPKSRKRTEPFRRACEILVRHRPPETPVGIVRAAYRKEQAVILTTLSELPQAEVDMITIVIVGNSRTYVAYGKMVTRRGYASKYNLEAT